MSGEGINTKNRQKIDFQLQSKVNGQMQNKTKEQEKVKQTKKKNGAYKFCLNRCLNDFILIFCFFVLTKNILSKTQKQRSALTLLATLSAAAKAEEKNTKKKNGSKLVAAYIGSHNNSNNIKN